MPELRSRRVIRWLPLDSEILGFSVPKPKRPANEDAMAFRVASATPMVWLLAVADGVSTSARGRDAARMTAASLWHGSSKIGNSDPASFLEASVVKTHHAIRSRLSSTGLASLVTALVLPAEATMVFVSVGDSLVCVRDRTGFRQVNPEDVTTQVRQLNAQTVLLNGAPVIDRAITQGIGIMGGIRPNVGVVDGLTPGSIVCLASDGVKATNLSAFLDGAAGMPDLDGIARFCMSERELSRDDTTLLLLRFGKPSDVTDIETELDAYDTAGQSRKAEIVSRLMQAKWLPSALLLRAFASESDESVALQLVPLLARSSPALRRHDLVPELERALLSGKRYLTMKLREVIRIAQT